MGGLFAVFMLSALNLNLQTVLIISVSIHLLFVGFTLIKRVGRDL
jgi:hypothetical protein